MYQSYEVDKAPLQRIDLPDSITIFMATWCGDSRREVPRFVKMLEAKNYDLERLKIVCLNTGFQNYKQSPEGEEKGVNLHRVPTFIFHDQNQSEVGRIVEEPVVSLEQDLVDILSGNPYKTAYPIAQDMIQKFETHSVSDLKGMMKSLVKEYAGKTKSAYELNTYGYVLWTSFQLTKAEIVFELNAKLHPESANVLSALARFKAGLGKEKEAIKTMNAGLEIEPENKRLLDLKSSLRK